MLYWFASRNTLKVQNIIILFSSYVFYGWWDWRFLSLIIFSTLVDFTIGKMLAKTNILAEKKLLLWVSIIVNLGLLGFFKYYNFFIENFIATFSFFGKDIQPNTLNIILPVGISFYTFQTLSYTIDVYKNRLNPTNDFIAFAAFVSFFPQLVAGPIERAKSLLPQFSKTKLFNPKEAIDGLRQILWGLFKKIVIADNCAEYANLIFNNPGDYNSISLFIGAVLFAFQIYCDFSGYSDIAIGIAKLFGYKLMKNFAFPYFSRNVGEFWRRWHISLSTWFRDYLYIPLGGSKGSSFLKIRNTFIIFLVSGFWHGANWTFIIWGALNAIYFLPLLLLKKNRSYLDTVAEGKIIPSFKEILQISSTFLVTVFAWIFFRSESLSHAFIYISGLLELTFFESPQILPYSLFMLLVFFILIEWIGRTNEHAIEKITNVSRPLQWLFYYVLIILMFTYTGKEQEFIYFQF
ncbi:UNVERIFIED_CONTAM: hypothetical protein GTU68_027192 [Idotea baltica]|nr:hypothetical protein [Idotea baltica]